MPISSLQCCQKKLKNGEISKLSYAPLPYFTPINNNQLKNK